MAMNSNHYNELGYWFAEKLFDSQQLDAMTEAVDKISSDLALEAQSNNARWHGAQMDKIDGVLFFSYLTVHGSTPKRCCISSQNRTGTIACRR